MQNGHGSVLTCDGARLACFVCFCVFLRADGLFAAVALYSCRPIAPHRELLVSYGERYAAEYQSGDSCELPSKPQSHTSLGLVPRSCVAFVPGSNDSEHESDESYRASDSADVDSSLLDQLHVKGGRGADDEHARGPDEAADVAAPLAQRVRALPVDVLSPVGWNDLLVQAAPFQRLLRVRVDAPLLVFGARSRQIQRVLLRFSAAWRRAHPGLVTFPTRPAVSVRRTDEFGVGDSVAIVLVTEHDTSVVEEAALRAEIGEQILANVDYTVRVERATPVM